MKSNLCKRVALLIPLTLALSCTKSEHPKLKQLEKQLSAAEESLSEIEAAIKKVPEQNHGLLLKLNQDKQLAISRLERLKENLVEIAPDKKWVPKATENSEGGSGGH
ncbi:MAG: hypothetical protein EBR01_08555 [Proteobacteria bacterium]|nr:hypothetical protein [Pseudomonadota bacterium]NBY20228.1 hypothetical protein [bacterium]